MGAKKQLAIYLSKIPVFTNPKANLEQYPTDSEVAADVLWNAKLMEDITEKTIADLGAGTGILGIAALELYAKHVFFVEKDNDVIPLLKENLSEYEDYSIIEGDVTSFNEKVDTVIMNPPFGVQQRKADKPFLESAFKIAKVTYYIGKEESITFLKKICRDHDKRITHTWAYDMPIKQSMKHHTKKAHKVAIICVRIA